LATLQAFDDAPFVRIIEHRRRPIAARHDLVAHVVDPRAKLHPMGECLLPARFFGHEQAVCRNQPESRRRCRHKFSPVHAVLIFENSGVRLIARRIITG
jgi:hypothetical protein